MDTKTFEINQSLLENHQRIADISDIVDQVMREIQRLPGCEDNAVLDGSIKIITRIAASISRAHDQYRMPTPVADALLHELWIEAIDLLEANGYEGTFYSYEDGRPALTS